MFAFIGIGVQELLIVLALFLLLFGGAKIPSLARNLGRSITEFKKGTQGIEDGSDDSSKSESSKAN